MRGIKWTSGIARQADVLAGARVLPNENGSASGFYLKANINPRIPSPHVFVLPGPPRELQPMFRKFAMPILKSIVEVPLPVERRSYSIAGMGESLVEKAIGEKVLAIPGIELGYCARPGEVEVRIIGDPKAIQAADAIIRGELGLSIFSDNDEALEEVVVRLLKQRKQTLATAESCTGGLIANQITNVSGASEVFLAGYVTYANSAKSDVLNVDSKLIDKHGAVSEAVARAMAEGARTRAASTYAARYDRHCRTNGRLGRKAGWNGLHRAGFRRFRDCRQEIRFPNGSRDIQTISGPSGTRSFATEITQGVTASQPSHSKITAAKSSRLEQGKLVIAHGHRRADFYSIVK